MAGELLVFYLLVITVNALVFSYGVFHPQFLYFFNVSNRTPWGILTAPFVHYTASHFAGNMLALGMFAIVSAGLIALNRINEDRWFGFMLGIGTLISSFIGNAVYYVLLIIAHAGGYSYGASGVVYGSIACTMVIALFGTRNSFVILEQGLPKMRKKGQSLKVIVMFLFSFMINGALVSWTFLVVFTTLLHDANFFVVEPGVNWLVHSISFASSTVITYLIYICQSRRSFLVNLRPT